ncbi:activity-regulated cytoskeleton associated protein 1-like [Cydia fagiglandana]|uniref:activity-regulated cytoskeleton associated protein 1-like n=1 Tax=Cydia fagiglandana TaxID=1458189 RepID=UPI002FEDF604
MPPKSRRNRRVSTPTRDDLEPAREGSFTRDDVATLVDSLQRSQTNAFRELLESVITTSRHPSSSTTSTPFPVEGGNFSRCKARFAGNAEESIEGFIDAIEAYKDCANISDDNAIRGLSILLTHSAADWWQGIKPEITSWAKVIDSLRHTYGDNRAPPRIYRDLFAAPQGEENTHVFVAKCRALLAKLPRSELAEKVQLDMVYGLLNKRIRKRVKREECATFKILLQKARAVEESLNESTNDTKAAAASKNVSYASPSRPVAVSKPPRATASASAAPPSREPRAPPPRRIDDNSDNNTASASAAKSKSYSKKCGYCKRYGHVKEECRKLNKDSSAVDFSGTNQNDEDSKEPTPGALMDQNDSEDPVLDLFDIMRNTQKGISGQF